MEKSGRWLRVSTGKQDEGAQLPDIQAWEESHDYDVKAEYIVHGGSAFKGNKKFDDTWARVIKDITNGIITVLVVWKTDRIDRKLQTYKMLEEVREAGGRVEFVTQTHLNQLTTMGGRIALKVQEEIAHEESRVKSDRVKAVLQSHRAKNALSSLPPFGYTSTGERHAKKLVPTPEGLKYVPQIFDQVIKGASLNTVAYWLDCEGVRNKGRKWSNSSVKYIINNRTYMGYMPDSDGNIIGTCEPLVDSVTFRRANDALKSRPKRGPVLKENRPLLSAILTCPKCDSPMYRLNSRGTGYSYRCFGRGAQRKGCGNMVKLDKVDAIVDSIMKSLNEPMMKRVFIPGHNHDAEIADVNFRIKQLDPESMSDEEYDAALKVLRAERDSYKTMENVPDSWKLVPVGQTYAQKWNSLKPSERNDWLRDSGVTVRAAKVGSESTIEPSGTISEAMDIPWPGNKMTAQHGYVEVVDDIAVEVWFPGLEKME